MEYLGIDVSEFNGNIDFSKVKKNGYDFVMVRCGYDERYTDPYWKQNVNNASSNGLKVGAYWFMYFTSEDEARLHAKIFLNHLNEFRGKINYPVALDVEEDTYRYMKSVGVNPTKELITKLVKIFCKEIEKGGYYVMIYSNHNGFDNYMGDVADFDVWLAQYNGKKPYKNCGIWQHTSEGKVNGINGNVDLNVSYRDYYTILRQANLNFVNKIQFEYKPIESLKLKVGDYVKVINPVIYGSSNKFIAWYDIYQVIEINGDRVVIGIGNKVTAPIHIKNIKKV